MAFDNIRKTLLPLTAALGTFETLDNELIVHDNRGLTVAHFRDLGHANAFYVSNSEDNLQEFINNYPRKGHQITSQGDKAMRVHVAVSQAGWCVKACAFDESEAGYNLRIVYGRKNDSDVVAHYAAFIYRDTPVLNGSNSELVSRFRFMDGFLENIIIYNQDGDKVEEWNLQPTKVKPRTDKILTVGNEDIIIYDRFEMARILIKSTQDVTDDEQKQRTSYLVVDRFNNPWTIYHIVYK